MRALLVALALLVLGAAPAGAETWHGGDPAGDVDHYTYDPDPAPCGTSTDAASPSDTRHDLTRIAVDHRADTIELSLALRRVSARDAQTTYELFVRTPAHDYLLRLDRPSAGRPLEAYLSKTPVVPDETGECGSFLTTTFALPCRGLAVRSDVRRDRVEVSLPRSCVHTPRWVQLGAHVYGFDDYDGQTVSGYDDLWAPPGTGAIGFEVPYGPRVRRS